MHLSYSSLRMTDRPPNNEPHRRRQRRHSENVIFAVWTTRHLPALYDCREQESKTNYTITV